MNAPDSPLKPWQTVWLRPTQTMQRLLLSREGDDWVTPLLLLGGILSALSPQMRQELLSLPADLRPAGLDEQSLGRVLLPLGLLSGLTQAFVWPLFLHVGAKILGAKTPQLRPARLAAAWSSLPTLLALLLAPLLWNWDAGVNLLAGLNALLGLWSLILLARMLAAGYQLKSGGVALALLLGGLMGFLSLFALVFLLTFTLALSAG